MLTSDKALLRFGAWVSGGQANDTYPGGGGFTFNFEDITVKLASGATATTLVAHSDDIHDIDTYLNASFTNCTFDTTAVTTSDLYLFTAHKPAYTVNVTVNGGEIKASSAISIIKTEGGNANSSLTFAKAEGGEYTRIVLPAAVSAPAEDFGGLKFVEESTDGTTTTYILVPTASIDLDFKPKASVTLDSNLIFNIYLPKNAGLGEATLNGVKQDLGEAVNGYYLITKELSAYEAAMELTLVVNLTKDGSDMIGSFTFSTVKYAAKLLEMNTSEKEVALAKDMLSYIRSAYNYFESVTEADKTAVTAEVTEILGDYNPTEIDKVTAPESKDDGDILSGATLVLKSTPAFRFVLHAGAKAEGYTFKIGNSVLEYTTGSFVDDNDVTYYYYDVSLYAYQMLGEITIEKDGKTASYHINTYYDGAVNTDENDIVTKFYNYCASAKAYRDYIITNR